MKKDSTRTVWLNTAILAGFTIYFVFRNNYEFLIYTVSIGFLIFILAKSDLVFKYSNLAKFGFTSWLIMHLTGGSLYISGTRLYDLVLIDISGQPYNILRYDQAVHIFCYVVMTMLIFSMVKYIMRKNANAFLVGLVTVLASMGVGALNEIIEFSTVVFFESNGVGGYYNNALDLVFNLLGAITAMAIITLQKTGETIR